MEKNEIIKSAHFNTILKTYMFLIVVWWSIVSLVGIVFIPFWLLIGWYFCRRYYTSLECTLTEKTVEIKKGVLFHVEKTIPLDRIQDLTLRDGPLLRALNLCMVEIETAGQSNPQGSDAKIIGIDDAKEFRNSVLKQRDILKQKTRAFSAGEHVSESTQSESVLYEIRDTLIKIEEHLKQSQQQK